LINTDYEMSAAHAKYLEGIALLPRDLRIQFARQFLDTHRVNAAEVIADLIGMANSVVDNSHELLKVEAVSRGLTWSHEAEKINFPSLHGALMGVSLAAGVDAAKVCAGCAFRRGSQANQCAPTQHDARDAVAGEWPFMCHEETDASGNCLQGCRGYALARGREKQQEKLCQPTT